MPQPIILVAISILALIIILLIIKIRKKKIELDELHQEISNYISSIQTNENSHLLQLKEIETKNSDAIKSYNGIFNELETNRKIEIGNAQNRISELENKYAPLLSLDKEIEDKKNNIELLKKSFETLNEKYQNALTIHQSLESEIELYTETLDINSYGLYKPRYSFDLPEQYLVELDGIYTKQKLLVKNHTAVVCPIEWTVGGSKTEGKKMVNQAIKLMLFGFNGECDAVIAKVKWNNVSKANERILKSFTEINNLGSVQHTEITREYLNLKLDELSLTYEYEKKKHEQKEEQRLIREQMREEEKVQKESEKMQHEAEEEAKLYNKVLEKARLELGLASAEEAEKLHQQIKSLEEKLSAAHEKRARAISLAQTTKVGNIYIISNVGSFGENIYKIGMTRRFDPMDRIRELSDAALPFQFDVHAIIYSENAPQFERDMHNKFSDKRINLVNNRKEFFKINIEEIESFVNAEAKAEIKFTKMAEAREYRQTLSLLEKIMNTEESKTEKNKFPVSLIE